MLQLKQIVGSQERCVPLKQVISIPGSGYSLAIAEDRTFYFLWCATESQTENVLPVELTDGFSSSHRGLVDITPHWHLMGYQKNFKLGNDIIYFYRVKEAIGAKDALLAIMNDKVIDYTFQESDNERYGNSWEWGDNEWEWDVIKRHIAN